MLTLVFTFRQGLYIAGVLYTEFIVTFTRHTLHQSCFGRVDFMFCLKHFRPFMPKLFYSLIITSRRDGKFDFEN